jgi:WXG100 family type VII secretion target
MAAPQVRSDYDQLKTVEGMFSAHADAISKTNQSIRSAMETLQGGDWIGKGATAFYKEMNDQVMPSMTRLQKALSDAARITKAVSALMKEAEDQASGVLHY